MRLFKQSASRWRAKSRGHCSGHPREGEGGCTDALEPGRRKVSSRSLKRPCLSWASKTGLGKDVRALLRRHTSGTEAIYSVDLGLPAVQELEELFWYVRKGIFCPDAEKHLRWAWSQRCEPVPEPEQSLCEPGSPFMEASDSSTSSSRSTWTTEPYTGGACEQLLCPDHELRAFVASAHVFQDMSFDSFGCCCPCALKSESCHEV